MRVLKKEKRIPLYKIVFFLKFIVELACFVSICILCDLSSKNPFEKHIIGNITNYFYGESDTATPITNNSKINNVLVDKASRKKKKINRYKNISSEEDIIRKIIVRKLTAESLCLEIHDNFERLKGKTLSNVFELYYGKIYKISIAILIISCILLFIIIINIIFAIRCFKNSFFAFITYIFILLLYVTRAILTIILFYYMEKGDIEKYDEFLDCKKIKTKAFSKFSDVQKIRICFFFFVILNITGQGIEKIEKCVEYSENFSGRYYLNNENI